MTGAAAAGPAARRSVVIATTPRSGSWLLAEALEGTEAVGHPREYLRADYEPLYAERWGLPARRTYRDYLDAVVAAGTSENGVFAIKVHWGQLEQALPKLRAVAPGHDGADLIARIFPRPRYVHLTRGDRAAQAVSLYRAVRTDQWWDIGDGPQPPPPAEPDWADIDRLVRTLTEHDEQWAAFLPAGTIRVTYEDLVTEYSGTVRRVLDELGLAAEAGPVPEPTLRRQADATSAAWVAAYRSRYAGAGRE